MVDLGLNSHHKDQIVNYIRFSKYRRNQQLKSVDGNFNDLKESRLVENTYTIDEVTEMLDGLAAVVRGEVEVELINMAHTNSLLLRQLFQQAEKWHLKLQADISELENKDLLDQIKDFEAQQLSSKADSSFAPKTKLEPLNEDGGVALLNMEIDRLKQENEKLRERMKALESQTTGILSEKNQLTGELKKTQNEVLSLRNQKPAMPTEDIEKLTAKMSTIKAEMKQNLEQTEAGKQAMESDLITTKHKLLEVQEQLEMAEQELEKKFSKTAAYLNMKTMLSKKNTQLKDLRKRLSNYESMDDIPVE